MRDRSDELLPTDLQPIAERLRDERYEVGALELDRIKRQAMAQASSRSPGNQHKGFFMRSKLLSTALAAGLLLVTASAGLAVTGNFPGDSSGGGGESASASRDRSASSSQYGGSTTCKSVRRGNRREEKSQRRNNRQDRRSERRGNRQAERGLRGRQRSRVVRINRNQERRSRQRDRGQQRETRTDNRAEERTCKRTGSP